MKSDQENLLDSANIPKSLKVVVVGDGAVGKTCLVDAYGKNGFPSEYVPTVAKNFESKIEYKGKQIALDIWDTGGQEEFKAIRPVSYQGANVIIVCFAVNDRKSLENACSAWKRELNDDAPKNVAKILVCTKCDLRGGSNPDSEIITTEEGEAKS